MTRRCSGQGAAQPHAPIDTHLDPARPTPDMKAQVAAAGPACPAVIGIDEISIRKGHVYRIIVSDLERGQPIWFGGTDRSDASMTMFYDFLGVPETAGMRHAVVEIWKRFRTATQAQVPTAALYRVSTLLRLNGSRKIGARCPEAD